MDTQTLWKNYGDTIYFFILKRVKTRPAAQDIYQNTFLKIHSQIENLREEARARAWIFQIARNEIANYFQQERPYVGPVQTPDFDFPEKLDPFCCFDRFLDELPPPYNEAVHIVYVEGKKQAEAARQLGIGLANLKGRLRRGKQLLKTNFRECCKIAIDSQGQLRGEPDCSLCE